MRAGNEVIAVVTDKISQADRATNRLSNNTLTDIICRIASHLFACSGMRVQGEEWVGTPLCKLYRDRVPLPKTRIREGLFFEGCRQMK